ncbi:MULTISPECIES: PadR family transcriptional regulator [Streptomyces]|uniref:DNA-binding transcriptional regulator, PadR family n=1 Tax=Streptomyces melanosporofaciens TaxID=67327 RepID=A0A1H4KF28_STRMJ|nr:PadR family transcriptional regulator [Streptomyces melanosporofaciens]SEB56542.1 DNA-binding transcriptional regulator, PadR family [Streptomyces melanosporofaciens]
MSTHTSRVLLGLLTPRAMHGYELKHAHDEHLPGAKPLPFGQVYATLNRLVRDGLAAEAGHERVGGPDRTAYVVTDLGRDALASWLSQIEPPAPHLSNVLLAKVVITLLVADEATARRHLAAQRAAHLARMRELTAVKSSGRLPVAHVLAADLAIAHLDADLRWMQGAVDRVTELRQEVHP